MELKFNVDKTMSDKEKQNLGKELVKILEKNKMIIRKNKEKED